MMDFANILGELKQAANADRQPKAVSRETLIKWANFMAGKGYHHTEASLAALHAYLQGYGVALTGDLGTGKTLFFRLLDIPILSMIDFAGQKPEDIRATLTNYYDRPLVLDDVGKEPKGTNYGEGYFEPLAICLEDRLWRNQPTHITMNLTEKSFIARYGDLRLLDRIYELCKPFKYAGKSQRHAVPRYADQR